MLNAWGVTFLAASLVMIALGAFPSASIAAELAVADFGLTIVAAVGWLLWRGAQTLLERRLRSAGTAWPPAPES